METTVRDLPFHPGALPALSEKLLRSHHQNNYAGAVRRRTRSAPACAGSMSRRPPASSSTA